MTPMTDNDKRHKRLCHSMSPVAVILSLFVMVSSSHMVICQGYNATSHHTNLDHACFGISKSIKAVKEGFESCTGEKWSK
jgi:hypothetical protein